MRSKHLRFAGALLLVSGLTACGGGAGGGAGATVTTPPLEGKLVQGPVKGATVYADRIGSGNEYLLDQAEQDYSSSTGNTGAYTLPAPPSGYGNYRLVSTGGTYSSVDSAGATVEKPAMQMIAPMGAKNITPLTTLVALNPALQAKIEATGITSYDIDISAATATPAALLLSKSVESVVEALGKVLDPNESKLSDAALAHIQNETMAAIATSLSSTSVNFTEPATLQAGLKTAISAAVTKISETGSGITVAPGDVAAIATAVSSTVDTVAGGIIIKNADGSWPAVSADPGSKTSESTLFSDSDMQKIEAAVVAQAATVETKVTVVAAPTVVLRGTTRTDIAVDSPLTVVFSRTMNAATITSTTFKINGVTGTVSYDSATRTATLTHPALSYETTYTVTLSGAITDDAGIALDPAFLTFTTVTRPLTGSTGATGSTGTGANF